MIWVGRYIALMIEIYSTKRPVVIESILLSDITAADKRFEKEKEQLEQERKKLQKEKQLEEEKKQLASETTEGQDNEEAPAQLENPPNLNG